MTKQSCETNTPQLDHLTLTAFSQSLAPPAQPSPAPWHGRPARVS